MGRSLASLPLRQKEVAKIVHCGEPVLVFRVSDHPLLRNMARFGRPSKSVFDNQEAGQYFLDVDTDEKLH